MLPSLVIALFPFLTLDDPIDWSSMSLSELLNTEVNVEVASKNAETIYDAPGVITVVKADEIRQFGAMNLVDVLNRVTSIYMLNTYYTPNNATSIRGDSQTNYDTHVLILLDGRPIRESMHGSMNVAVYKAFPVEALDRIEIIRGPGSVLYGAGAYSGVINLVTKIVSTVSVTGGSDDNYSARVGYHYQKNDLDFGIFAGKSSDNGWLLSAVDESGTTSEINLTDESESWLLSMGYKDLKIRYLSLNTDHDYWGTTPAGTGASRNLTRDHFDLGYAFERGDWNVDTHLTYNLLDIENAEPFKTRDLLAEVTAMYRANEQLSFTLGGLVMREKGEFGTVIPKYDRDSTSYYAQLEYRPNERTKAVAGGQYNRPDSGSSDFVPRLALLYNLNTQSGFKLLYGEAFRSPTATETDFQAPPIISGNPDLDPEKVATTEFQYYWDQDTTKVTATLFHVKQKNLIGRFLGVNDLPGFSYANHGTGTFQGMELELTHIPSENLFTSLSATYQENEDLDGHDGFTTMPSLMIKLALAYQYNQWDIGLFDTYIGAAKGVESTNPGVQAVNPEASAYHDVSLNLAYNARVKKNDLRLSLYVQNLLDEDMYQPEFVRRRINTIPIDPGRRLFGKISYRF